jgi:cytochrome b
MKVWDPAVRLLHWTLVLAVAGASASLLSAWPWGGLHQPAGWLALAVVVLRLAWGLVGSRQARFTSFLRSPRATLAYARLALRGHEPRHLGHNPLGGWMIVTLLATLGGICITGWLYTTERFWGVGWVENLHEGLTNVLIVLVVLHVGGVIFSSLRHGENLVAAMVHGRKRAPSEHDIS